MKSTRFVTFYSYKGGVGRTLAVGNIAWKAALEGKKVVVIDFDLEASGIPSLIPFRDAVEEHKKDKEKRGGIFELMLYFQKHQMTPSIPDLFATKPIIDDDFDAGGEIYIIPAGKEDSRYRDKLQGFNWEKFYSEEGGREFFLRLRDNIQYQFDNPDLVIIDSRTGLTDIGGICTVLLPDKVVILSGLNDQNLNGCKSIIDSINRHSEIRKKENYLEPIDVITVATHVPFDQEMDKSRERLEEAKKILGKEIDVAFPYVPILSLEERILIQEQGKKESQAETLVVRYNALYKKITQPYTEIEKQIAEKLEEFKNLQLRSKLDEALLLGKEIIHLCKKNGIISGGLIDLYYLMANIAFSKEKYEESIECFKNAENILLSNTHLEFFKTSLYDFYSDFGASLGRLGRKLLSEGTEVLKKAIEKLQKAIEIKSDDSTSYYNLGTTLSYLADISSEENKAMLLKKAIKQYQKAIEINPNYTSTYDNYITALLYNFHLTSNQENLHEAFKLTQKAQELGLEIALYNTTCIYSLLGEKENAFDNLSKVIENKLESKEHIQEDSDLDLLRDDPRFQELLDQYDSEEKPD